MGRPMTVNEVSLDELWGTQYPNLPIMFVIVSTEKE
jgi:hypothetical protein